MIIYKAYKFRLKTNYVIEQSFERFAGCTRFVWNRFLVEQKIRMENGEKIESWFTLNDKLVILKQEENTTFLKNVPAQILRQKSKDLRQAFSDFFDKNQKTKLFPKFKKKGLKDSFRYPQGFRINGNRIFLPKIGWVRFFKSRKIEGEIRTVTVSRKGQHWYISIQVKQKITEPIHTSRKIVGIDMGVVRFATLSDGMVIEPLNSFRKSERHLAKEQRRLSNKKKGSQNRRKQKNKVSKLLIRIANARQDFLHKTSTEISKNHAMIIIEDLKVQNMTKSAKGTLKKPGKNVKVKSRLNKAILDQGWFEFRRQLEYKQKWRGGEVVAVNPYCTSQTCPECKTVSKENRKTRTKFKCVNCGYIENADLTAARNILAAGHAVTARGENDIGRLIEAGTPFF